MTFSFSSLAFVGLILALMVASSLSDQGPCSGGFWPDGDGCCPIVVKGNAYYRDFNNKCYPKEIKYNLFYADSNGCYPDEYGNYLASDKSCPKEQKCYPSCEKPNEYQYTTTQEYYPPKTTSEEYKTTTEQYYPPKTTSEEHKTTSKQHKTTTQKHKTTSQYYPQTTSEEYMTTQEYYPPKTTSQQHNNQCPYNKEKDGNGCCPREIDGMWFYRDGRGCYPIKTYGGVLYADGNGCYPDDKGSYLQAGAKCPYERQCKPECDGNAYN